MHHRIVCMRVCLYACGRGHVCEYVGVCAQVGLCLKFARTPVHGVRNSQAVILTAKAVTTGARAMLLIRKYFCTKHTQRASSHNMEPRRRKSLPWSASSKSLSSLAHQMQFCLPIYIGRVRHADRSYDTATIVTYERIASIALKYTLQRHLSSATIAHNFQGKI